jgi:lipoyl-dependent peroxiredoxin
MISKIKPLVTATASCVGGRNGHSETTDHSVSVDLSVRKEMGGPGKPGTTTPEHLFATGYAACFGGALDFVAKSHKKDAAKAKVTCAVSIGPREAGGFGLAVKMTVSDPSLPTRPSSRNSSTRRMKKSAPIRMRRATISRSSFPSRAPDS